MNYQNITLQAIQNFGFKLTEQRRQIVELLSNSKFPLSTHEMQLETGIPAVSIYRILQLLQDLGLAHKVHGTKYLKCHHLEVKEGCHHFMVCNDCGLTEEFIDKHSHKAPSKSFVATSHTFEINGFCKKCYKK